ncbi:hypothetical protein GOBAR_AA07320 [Gossypium barbadense]|uniref:DUF4283 domain-containing protein n=1 Tax=Gossypium barbadense TaxID=3634 RepID=A0A2P5YCR0_GOSBA|nr:hypothetical protein GOBAR_AA07320 [Gossypium barbadense]
MEVLIPKKVCFRDKLEEVDTNMDVHVSTKTLPSWKKQLVGQPSKANISGLDEDKDFDIMNGDIQKSIVTIVVKLLGRNIGYSILHSKIYSIWKPSSQFKLIDIENGYFLAKFQNKLDCEKILFESPYFIFGEYLTVQPWTMSFNPSQQFPSIFISWIKLLGLPGYLYKWKFLLAIRGLIERVAKLDMNTNNKVKRHFARIIGILRKFSWKSLRCQHGKGNTAVKICKNGRCYNEGGAPIVWAMDVG